ncbi:MAG TPA: SDR family NAD(P)-dependent oxidoreductase [Ktedonobacterales bacterium]|nr:SDR family NAD(P)-dependent oxidoreductase [Ktedonobacterales bacterium]
MTAPTPNPSGALPGTLANRVALVTGALGGLGPAVCQTFIAAGATVVGVASESSGRHGSPADALAALRATLPADAIASRLTLRTADLSDESSVAQLVAGVVSDFGRLEIAVNLVGGYAAGQPVSALDADVWDSLLTLNARTTFLVSKHVAAPMARQQWGRIVNISSRAALAGRRNAAAYAVAKQAVITLTEAQAEELRDDHITVNAVLPSIIDTPANRAAMPKADTSRWPTAEQIARVIAFLASDDAAIISGAAIPVYGLA